MYKTVAISIKKTGDFLNVRLENRYAIYLVMAVFTLLFISTSYIVGISKFSPDSWTYFELSKAVFGENFYRFNTIRSYLPSEYAASFPLGFPLVIALASLLIGQDPMIAVIINIITAIATGFLLFNICKLIKIPTLASFAIICSLLFYQPYIDEIFSGRSIPFAVLIFLTAYYFYLKNRLFISGIIFGFSALIRFDFLIYAILFQITVFVLQKKQSKYMFSMLVGFLIGILPWVAYSYIHFGKLWISDNSWVAISAFPAYVLDYPASPVATAFQDPLAWVVKIIRNTPSFFTSIIRSAIKFPLLVVFFLLVLLNWTRVKIEVRYSLTILFIALFISVSPYLLTGYFDARYFSLFFLVSSIILVYVINKTNEAVFLGIGFYGFIFLSLALTTGGGIYYLLKDAWAGVKASMEIKIQAAQIKTLNSCHQLNLSNTYIFTGDASNLTWRYGAVTGMRTAALPSNFNSMSEEEKVAYFEHMKPYISIESLSQVEKCIIQ